MRRGVCLFGLVSLFGCQLLSGVGDLEVVSSGGAGGASAASTSSPSSSTSSSGTCAPGSMVACYDGPKNTEGVGLCHGGKALCDQNGVPGKCVGEVGPAPENCATTEDEDCDGTTPTCTGALQEHASFGGAGADEARAIAFDAVGAAYVTGTFSGAVEFGGTQLVAKGTRDIFVLKLDGQGSVVWVKQFGGSTDQEANAITVDRDGDVIVGGSFWGTVDFMTGLGPRTSAGGADAFILYLDEGGNATFDGVVKSSAGDDVLTQLGLDFDLDVIVGGDVQQDGQSDIWLEEVMQKQATPIWQGTYGDGNDQHLTAMGIDVQGPSGSLVVGGSSKGILTLENGQSMSTATKDGFIAKFDQHTGGTYWVKALGDPAIDDGGVFGLDYAAGSISALGSFAGNLSLGKGVVLDATSPNDFYVALLDVTTGDSTWASQGSVAGTASPTSMSSDAAGNIVIGGQYQGSIQYPGADLPMQSGTNAGFVAKLDGTSGAALWSTAIAGTDDATVLDVRTFFNGATVGVAGWFRGTATVDGVNLTSQGDEDAYAVVLAP